MNPSKLASDAEKALGMVFIATKYGKGVKGMIGSIMAKKVCRSGFAALNEGDLATFLGKWAEDSVFIYPPVSPAL